FAPAGDVGAGSRATVLAAIDRLPDGAGADTQALAAALHAHGLEGAIGGPVHLFAGSSRAGEEAKFRSGAEAIYLLHAPGAAMAVDGGEPPTDLLVLVHRARPRTEPPPLPPPLPGMREELRVERASARAYAVKAGDYIQIIDVAGAQRSDFVAFDARRLDQGVERGLDAAATRASARRLNHGLGLWSAVFDQDLKPLVEVVRDTVGRHDAFFLACTARDYEAAGHPGHASCAANFNAALAPYGIAARVGWPALNLFSNAPVDGAGRVHVEAPWSRPGDYVLLRAATDLVCASSACADDMGPTNGGEPSDIHVRIYAGERAFSRAVAFRATPEGEPELTRESAFHARTAALAEDFVEHCGFWLPSAFRGLGALAEYRACRETAAVVDRSALRKVEVLGPDAVVLIRLATTCDAARLAPGQVAPAAVCHDHGGLIDDGTLFRLGPERFRWVGGAAAGPRLREVAAARKLAAWVKSSTDQLHNLLVLGPRSRDIVADVVWTPPSRPAVGEIDRHRFTVGCVGDLHGAPVLASHTERWGAPGYELFCHPADGTALWDAVWAAGAPHGLRPMGREGFELVRIEAGVPAAGRELDGTVDPFEAGLGPVVSPLREDDFIGRKALRQRGGQPRRRLVGLVLEGEAPAAHGAHVLAGSAPAGTVTSTARSPRLGRPVALALLDIVSALPGTTVEVLGPDGHRRRRATVVRLPFHDPQTAPPTP
ncbi:MAG: DUF1989 domain-containing protein, partial [Rhodospirillaceae bacterium]|nr:DUF1989 domain-containing protein [Rhodospirillaceae bacterium]